jgi:hypothetical protein
MGAARPRALSRLHGHAGQRRLPALEAGQKEAALALLERVFAKGWGKRDWIERDPDYDIVRDDLRFKKLLAQLK